MYLKFSSWKHSKHEWDEYFSDDKSGKDYAYEEHFLPLKPGVVDVCQHFEITGINANGIEVCYSDDLNASYGTYSNPDPFKANRINKKKISPDSDSSILICESESYNGSQHTTYYKLELVDEPRSYKTWNMLRVQHGDTSVTFQRNDFPQPEVNLCTINPDYDCTKAPWLDFLIKIHDDRVRISFKGSNIYYYANCENPLNENGVTVSLIPCVRLVESDIDNNFFSYYINPDIWENHEKDADAALAVAESIAEQTPEALEIIADYMAIADDLGSADAHAWLADYYGATDSKYDAYV